MDTHRKICVLGIETSCDETGIALFDSQNPADGIETVGKATQSENAFGGICDHTAAVNDARGKTNIL